MCDSLKSPYETKFKIIKSKCIRCKRTLVQLYIIDNVCSIKITHIWLLSSCRNCFKRYDFVVGFNFFLFSSFIDMNI